jgi:hypothetical protein
MNSFSKSLLLKLAIAAVLAVLILSFPPNNMPNDHRLEPSYRGSNVTVNSECVGRILGQALNGSISEHMVKAKHLMP